MVENDFGFQPKKDISELVKEMDNMNIIDQKKSLVEQLQMQMGCDDEDEMPQIVDTEEGYAF